MRIFSSAALEANFADIFSFRVGRVSFKKPNYTKPIETKQMKQQNLKSSLQKLPKTIFFHFALWTHGSDKVKLWKLTSSPNKLSRLFFLFHSVVFTLCSKKVELLQLTSSPQKLPKTVFCSALLFRLTVLTKLNVTRYVTDILNCLQGVIIFVVMILCRKRVWNNLAAKRLCCVHKMSFVNGWADKETIAGEDQQTTVQDENRSYALVENGAKQ